MKQQGTVLYTYCANKPGQLSILKGDKIELLEASLRKEWWLVEREDGKRGLAPGSYIVPADPVALENDTPPPYEEVSTTSVSSSQTPTPTQASKSSTASVRSPSFRVRHTSAGNAPPKFGKESATIILKVMRAELPVRDHKIRLKTYKDTLSRAEIVSFLEGHLHTRDNEICNGYIDEWLNKKILTVISESSKGDQQLFKLITAADEPSLSEEELVSMMKQMLSEITLKDKKYKYENIKNCFTGTEAVRWVNRYLSVSEETSSNMLTRCLESKAIYCCTSSSDTFLSDDNHFYKFAEYLEALGLKPKITSNIPTGTALKLESTLMARVIAVRQSWKAACNKVPGEQFPMNTICDLIHTKFYELRPDSKLIIGPDDITVQSRALGGAISVLVNNSDTIDKTFLKNIGKNHKELGIIREHYVAFGVALMEMLKTRLGSKFHQNARVAWAQWYIFITQYILKGAGEDHKLFKNECEKAFGK